MLEIHIELFNLLDLKFGPHAKPALSQSTTGSSKWTAVNVATCVWCRRSCPVSVRHTCGGICARLAYFGHWNVGHKTDRVLNLLCSSLFQVCSLYCPNLGICRIRNLDSLPLLEKQTSTKKKNNKKKKTARDTHTISKSGLSYTDEVYRLCCWLLYPGCEPAIYMWFGLLCLKLMYDILWSSDSPWCDYLLLTWR